jgi:hypothetical protein
MIKIPNKFNYTETLKLIGEYKSCIELIKFYNKLKNETLEKFGEVCYDSKCWILVNSFIHKYIYKKHLLKLQIKEIYSN